MTEVWGAIVVIQTDSNQYGQLLSQTYPSQAAASSGAATAALALKNQFTTALGNLLPQLFISVDLNDSQPIVWIRAAQVVAIRPQVYQYS